MAPKPLWEYIWTPAHIDPKAFLPLTYLHSVSLLQLHKVVLGLLSAFTTCRTTCQALNMVKFPILLSAGRRKREWEQGDHSLREVDLTKENPSILPQAEGGDRQSHCSTPAQRHEAHSCSCPFHSYCFVNSCHIYKKHKQQQQNQTNQTKQNKKPPNQTQT